MKVDSQKIIALLKKAQLKGRSGSQFPTGEKWEMVVRQSAPIKYVICNAAEGEPGVNKDEFILRHYPQEAVQGIKLAITILQNQETKVKGFIYLKKPLFHDKKLRAALEKEIGSAEIKFFCEPGGYLCGEETTLLNSMEGKRCEPRLKPPYPTAKGLKGCPTLVNNVETFYCAAKIYKQEYDFTRFVSIAGAAPRPGVYNVPLKWTLREILRMTHNYPDFPFFLQVGGGACGEIKGEKDLRQPLNGLGSIIIYHQSEDALGLLRKWIDFHISQSCGKCVPCREGGYRLREILQKEPIDWQTARELLENMQQASFCGLGLTLPRAFLSLMDYKGYGKDKNKN